MISSNFYNDPSGKLKLVGVTGTNGKTSIAFYLKGVWEEANIKGASIGTLGVRYQNKYISTKLTTPDPTNLHKYIDFLKRKKFQKELKKN